MSRPRKGTFGMAKWTPDGGTYEPTPCYIVGPFAIHRAAHGREWCISHAATGMGLSPAFGETLAEATKIATQLQDAIIWDAIKRGPRPGAARGMNRARRMAIAKAMYKAGLRA